MKNTLRWLTVLVFVGLPIAAMATDSAAPASSSLQPTGGAASAPQTLNLLQPATAGSAAASIQSADASGGGVSQSTTQDLQQTGSSDQVNLLVQGGADQPQQLSNNLGITWLGYAALVLLAATVVTAVIWWLQRRRD